MGKRTRANADQGAALVEFALVLPLLVILLLGIADVGLLYHNSLQLTHAARDSVRYASVGDETGANAAIGKVNLVFATLDSQDVTMGSSGSEATVVLHATYSFQFLPFGDKDLIRAAIMRRE